MPDTIQVRSQRARIAEVIGASPSHFQVDALGIMLQARIRAHDHRALIRQRFVAEDVFASFKIVRQVNNPLVAIGSKLVASPVPSGYQVRLFPNRYVRVRFDEALAINLVELEFRLVRLSAFPFASCYVAQ